MSSWDKNEWKLNNDDDIDIDIEYMLNIEEIIGLEKKWRRSFWEIFLLVGGCFWIWKKNRLY